MLFRQTQRYILEKYFPYNCNYFKNLYQTNIKITACTFENITDCAISAVNFKNIEFTGNKFLNCKYSVFYRDNGK